MVNPDVVTTRVVPIGQTVAIILNTPASTNTGIPTNGVWVIAGVHGDEPVPPYALFTRWRSFSWQTPTVVIPFANPSTLVAPSRTKRYGLGFDGGVAGNEEFWAGVESVAAQFVVPRLVLALHEDGDGPRRAGGGGGGGGGRRRVDRRAVPTAVRLGGPGRRVADAGHDGGRTSFRSHCSRRFHPVPLEDTQQWVR